MHTSPDRDLHRYSRLGLGAAGGSRGGVRKRAGAPLSPHSPMQPQAIQRFFHGVQQPPGAVRRRLAAWAGAGGGGDIPFWPPGIADRPPSPPRPGWARPVSPPHSRAAATFARRGESRGRESWGVEAEECGRSRSRGRSGQAHRGDAEAGGRLRLRAGQQPVWKSGGVNAAAPQARGADRVRGRKGSPIRAAPSGTWAVPYADVMDAGRVWDGSPSIEGSPRGGEGFRLAALGQAVARAHMPAMSLADLASLWSEQTLSTPGGSEAGQRLPGGAPGGGQVGAGGLGGGGQGGSITLWPPGVSKGQQPVSRPCNFSTGTGPTNGQQPNHPSEAQQGYAASDPLSAAPRPNIQPPKAQFAPAPRLNIQPPQMQGSAGPAPFSVAAFLQLGKGLVGSPGNSIADQVGPQLTLFGATLRYF